MLCYRSVLCKCQLLSLKLLSFCMTIHLQIIPLHVVAFFSVLQGLALKLYIFSKQADIPLNYTSMLVLCVFLSNLTRKDHGLVGVVGLSQLCLVNDMFLFSNCVLNRICKLSCFFLLPRNLSVAKGSHDWHYELSLFDGISIPSFLSTKMWSSILCCFIY